MLFRIYDIYVTFVLQVADDMAGIFRTLFKLFDCQCDDFTNRLVVPISDNTQPSRILGYPERSFILRSEVVGIRIVECIVDVEVARFAIQFDL